MSAIYKSKLLVGGKEKVVVCINHDNKQPKNESITVEQLHHLFILDKSGSMWDEWKSLVNNVKASISSIPDGDLITVISFSSNGNYRVVVKGMTKSEKLFSLIDSISVGGCTCFSDPLQEAKQIVEELGYLAPVSITLFTDGCPVVPWGAQKEYDKVNDILSVLGKNVIAINTIGFGNYYNQEFLKNIAEYSEYGEFVHSSYIDDFVKIFDHNFEKISDAVCEGVYINAPEIIYLTRSFTKLSYEEMELSRIDKRKNQFFLIGDDEFFFEYNGESFSTETIKVTSKIPEATLTNFLYAYAYNLYYENRRLESLDVLSKNLFDKNLIDSHLESFTFSECGVHIERLNNALFDSEYRFSNGKCSSNYLPDEHALCVMDILNLLQSTDSYYIPFSKNINYTRIGRKAVNKFNLFEQTEEEIRAPFSDFVYHKEHMNLSVRFYIKGKVSINPKQAKAVGLDSELPSGMFRNHTIIKDGNLNMKSIECIVPSEIVDTEYMNVIENLNLNNDDGPFTHTRVIIFLDQFPIVNRSYIKSAANIEYIFDVVKHNADMEAYQKVVKYYLDEIMTDTLKKTGVLKDFTVDQIRLLEEHGLDKNLNYNPKLEKVSAEESDSYESRVIQFYLSGFSTWGKISEMLDRVANNKKLTPNLEMLKANYDYINKRAKDENIDLTKSVVKTRDFLTTLLADIKKVLLNNRNELAVLRIAKCLSGDWYPELTVDKKGNYVYEKDGLTMICKTAYTTEYF